LVPTAFAAGMPAGTVVSNGLTWTRNNSTVGSSGKSNWSAANNTCQALTAGGYSNWRLPVNSELNALDKSLLKSAGWAIDYTWAQTPGNGDGGYHYMKWLGNGPPLVMTREQLCNVCSLVPCFFHFDIFA
jgi:hypothetical protein